LGESLVEHIPAVLSTLADLIQNHLYDDWEVKDAREKYEEFLENRYKGDANKEAQSDDQIMEAVHSVAYHNNTLGLPVFAPKHNLELFNSESLRQHVKRWYTPSRMVVAGVGVNHEEFVKLTESLFTELGDDVAIQKEKAEYTGGELRLADTNADVPFTSFALAFQTASVLEPDLIPLCVLQSMLGGGGSFSSGGPGKGMYSRLYLNVLNKYDWVSHAQSFIFLYTDSSLFGFFGKCSPCSGDKLVNAFVEEAHRMTEKISEHELIRAKNLVKYTLLSQMEERVMKLDDIGRQLLYGKIEPIADIIAKIDQVTAHDLNRVANNMLKMPPTVVSAGDLSLIPRFDAIAAALRLPSNK